METFRRAWTATTPVQVSTSKAYLFVIARNLYLDSLRGKRNQEQFQLEKAPEPVTPGDAAKALETWNELEQTSADLKEISPGDRAALVMPVFRELSHEEAARALGISVGSLKSRIFMAGMRLHELREKRR